ncbi:jg27649 [Pararge aegeria aegeria]|uniref:Jg27649 protein n=1 Tax=Pararge aegeria aegeria TaxID=348720 RepID=A0A8S4QXV5_9NEOP|nr:jg27649 [Pararge aegeria aegeria]
MMSPTTKPLQCMYHRLLRPKISFRRPQLVKLTSLLLNLWNRSLEEVMLKLPKPIKQRKPRLHTLIQFEISEEEPFSGGSDEEYQPNDEDEQSEDTEVIADFIASSAGRSTESPSPTPASSSSSYPSDARWKRDVLPLRRETFIENHGVQNIDAITEDGRVSLSKIYAYFAPDDLIDVMVIHTNNYAAL